MTQEQVDARPSGQIGREPLNLSLEGRSTRDAFLLISSRLAGNRWPDHSHTGNWLLSSSIDNLPRELANIAIMLGLKRNVTLNIRTEVKLNSSREPDYDSVNKMAVVFFGLGSQLVYEYDNRSWKLWRRDPYHRMSLKYEAFDSNCSQHSETDRQTELLKRAGVFKKREVAFRGFCEFLNNARLEASYF